MKSCSWPCVWQTHPAFSCPDPLCLRPQLAISLSEFESRNRVAAPKSSAGDDAIPTPKVKEGLCSFLDFHLMSVALGRSLLLLADSSKFARYMTSPVTHRKGNFP